MICILSNKIPTYTETFIQSHIKQLPTEIRFLYGQWFPQHHRNGEYMVKYPAFNQFLKKFFLRLPNSLSTPYEQLVFKRLLKAQQVDAVLAEYGPTGVAVCDVCARANIPLIVHYHGHDAYRHKMLDKYSQGYRRLFQRSAAIIAVSRHMEQQLLQLGAVKDRVHYNPYGVDTSLFKTTKPAENLAQFIAVGRFVEKKAPQLTIQAFKQVIDNVPDAQLVFIGDGPLLMECQNLVNSFQISNSVKFLGACSPEQVATQMQKARAFVQHSITATGWRFRRYASGDSRSRGNGSSCHFNTAWWYC